MIIDLGEDFEYILMVLVILQNQPSSRSEEYRQLFHLPPEEVSMSKWATFPKNSVEIFNWFVPL